LLEVGGVPNSERLAIINFPNSQRLRGVVIKDGGALISVNAAPVEAAPSNVRSLDDWVRWYEKNEEALDDRDIPTSTPAPGGCQQLRRIVTREDMGSGAFSIGTVYFCSTKHGLYVVILSNWEGDPHQGDLQDTALKIAKSLRSR
jgi:hypothetical protein